MADFVFVSPSVKFKETDISTRIEQLGVTSLGLIGETLKGTAFQPISVRDKTSYTNLFGSQSTEKIGGVPRFPVSFAANNFLEESNNLTVVRVLGLSGYNAGVGYGIKMKGKLTKSGAPTYTDSISLTGTSLSVNVPLEFTFHRRATNLRPDTHLAFKSTVTALELFTNTQIGESLELPTLYFKTIFNAYFAVDLSFNLVSRNSTHIETTITYTVYDAVEDSENKNKLLAVIRPTALYSSDILSFNSTGVTIANNFTPSTFVVTANTATMYEEVTTTTTITTLEATINIDTLKTQSETVRENDTHIYFDNCFIQDNLTLQGLTANGGLVVSRLVFKTIVYNKTNQSVEKFILYKEDNSNFVYNAISGQGLQNDVFIDTSIVTTVASNTLNFTGGSFNIVRIQQGVSSTGDVTATTYNYFVDGGIVKSNINNPIPFIVGFQNDPSTSLNPSVIVDNVNGFYDDFTLISSRANASSESFSISFNPNSKNYIGKVLGRNPKEKPNSVWLETAYPQLYKMLYNTDNYMGISLELVELNTSEFTNYQSQYKKAETPYVVSELRGNKVERLFKFLTITDGHSGNRDVKISILNVDPETREFDLYIRDFKDTDERPVILETYTRCTLDETLANYIGKRIGEWDVENESFKYDQKSQYVYLVMAENFPQDAFPCGFEGYVVRSYANADEKAKIVEPEYKLSYANTDKVSRTYLGITEKAYNTSVELGTSINEDLFNFYGSILDETTLTKTKGFHLDKDVTGTTFVNGSVVIGQFEGGISSFKSQSDVLNTSNAYFNKGTRKFTFVPSGGFDGWDEHRLTRTNTDIYTEGSARAFSTSDWVAYNTAINLLVNAEEFEVNLLATPNLDWSNNLTLVKNIVEIMENRGDCFYIIDAPDVKGSNIVNDLVSLLSFTDLDTNYAGTYGTWIEVTDNVTGQKLFLPPSVDIVRVFARNDNQRFEWFAAAGLNYGSLNATNVRKRLSEPDRDSLYSAGINPIALFNGQGISVFGNKTLQRRESALDRINVRRLILSLRKSISTISRALLFDQNDDVVRKDFEAKVSQLMTSVRTNRGITDYQLVGDNSNPEVIDRNQMLYVLKIKPTRSLEYIGVEFIITPTGASFAEV